MLTVIGCDGREVAIPPDATLLVGAARHLPETTVEQIVLGPLAPALERIKQCEPDGHVVVLASGDPGFFGIVRALRAAGFTPTVVPAVSSVATAFARAGLTWDDAIVVSAHGRDARRALNVCRAHPKVAVLTSPDFGPDQLRAHLPDRTLVVAEHLGMPDEQLSIMDATPGNWRTPNVVLVLAADSSGAGAPSTLPDGTDSPTLRTNGMRDGESSLEPGAEGTTELRGDGDSFREVVRATPREATISLKLRAGRADPATDSGGPGWVAGTQPGPARWGLAESAFEHRDSMITKAEVRAYVLARLGPRVGDLVWDIGAGSGSVGVECARFGAAVVAVERDPAAIPVIERNAAGLTVQVVQSDAPEGLDALPQPDAVFVGGGGIDVLAACLERRPERIVVAVAAVERAGAALQLIAAAGYDAEGVQLQASRMSPLPGGGHRLAAINPVFVVSGLTSSPP